MDGRRFIMVVRFSGQVSRMIVSAHEVIKSKPSKQEGRNSGGELLVTLGQEKDKWLHSASGQNSDTLLVGRGHARTSSFGDYEAEDDSTQPALS